MTKPPLVSVVLPVYNGERFLRNAIDSVLSQTYRAIELVAVDDGSTDGSPALLASYGERIVVVRRSNGGVAQARNSGVRASSGRFVAFLDQDDWWQPTKIEKQVAAMLADDEVDLVHTAVSHYDDQAGAFVERLNPVDNPHEVAGRCYERLLIGNAIYNVSVMVRRSAIDRVGGFDDSIGGNTVADYDLWLRIARDSKFAFLPEALAVFRLHTAQGTWKRRDMRAAELRVLERQVPPPARRGSPQLRQRFAGVIEELGLAQLEGGERSAARGSFAHALGYAPTLRRVCLYSATFLPPAVTEMLQTASARLRRGPRPDFA